MTGFSIVQRDVALDRMSKTEFDLVVVGGGITGAGIALDASTRGLRVALVEKGDFASGTSSRSSRLIHGGLRYLRQREFGLVHEALRERQNLFSMAPHLVRPLPFLLPIFEESGFDKMKTALRAGLWLYDIAGGARGGRFHRHVGIDTAMEMAPALAAPAIRDAFIYWDAVNDDARMTLAVIRTAAIRYGALVANYCAVEGISTSAEGHSGDKRLSVNMRDGLTGATLECETKSAILATGVWSDRIDVPGSGAPEVRRIRPAKGIHIVLPNNLIPGDAAVLLPVPSDDRFIFTIPWGNYTLVGTTDSDYSGTLDSPSASEQEIAYLLETVNAWVAEPVERASVTGTFAGLRPLAAQATTEKTADMSRRHTIELLSPGVAAIYGGKFTTWRSMAAEAVDFVGEQCGLGPLPKAATSAQHLDGAAGEGDSEAIDANSPANLDADLTSRIAARYGGHARAVLTLAEEGNLADAIHPRLDYLNAEVVFAVRHEMAVTLDDILTRRTRATTDNWGAAHESASGVVKLLGSELGWSPERECSELKNFSDAAAQYDPRPPAHAGSPDTPALPRG